MTIFGHNQLRLWRFPINYSFMKLSINKLRFPQRRVPDATPSPVASARAGGRLLSLDVLRGLTVMGMILVNAAAAMFYGQKAAVYPALLHAPWAGLTLADFVFPAFLMMVGVAIPLAGAGSASVADRRSRILARAARLFALGFLLSNIYWFADFDSGAWRLFGVLQRIGLVYGACALLVPAIGPRARLGVIAAILLLYWPLVLIPGLDGLAADLTQRGHNFAASVDRALLGAGGHIYVPGPAGYDPEGLLGTLPAIAHGLIGVAVGEHLLRRPGRGSVRTLLLAGVAMLATGLAWSPFFPIIKDIWSSSFVLVTGGATIVLLALLHAWIDGPGLQSAGSSRLLTVPLAFGANAIAAYGLHMVTGGLLGWDLLLAPYASARAVLPDEIATLVPILLYMALIWAVVDYLRRKGWSVKI